MWWSSTMRTSMTERTKTCTSSCLYGRQTIKIIRWRGLERFSFFFIMKMYVDCMHTEYRLLLLPSNSNIILLLYYVVKIYVCTYFVCCFDFGLIRSFLLIDSIYFYFAILRCFWCIPILCILTSQTKQNAHHKHLHCFVNWQPDNF